MPTKKKRVGFIPREEVMKIIDRLSIENNLSNSKIISILVEEALSIRGMFDKTTGKPSKSYEQLKNSSEYLPKNSGDSKDNKNLTTNTKFENHKNSAKTILYKETNQTGFDMQTYKKFLSFLKFQEMIDEYDS